MNSKQPIFSEQDHGTRYADTRWRERLQKEDEARMLELERLIREEVGELRKRTDPNNAVFAYTCGKCGRKDLATSPRRRFCPACVRKDRISMCVNRHKSA